MCTYICFSTSFQFLWVYIPRSENAGSYVNSLFNFIRNHQTIFHSHWIILHSHYQCLFVDLNFAKLMHPHPTYDVIWQNQAPNRHIIAVQFSKKLHHWWTSTILTWILVDIFAYVNKHDESEIKAFFIFCWID